MKISVHPLGPDLHSNRVTLDRELATRMRASFQVIAGAADTFTDRFYDRLFAAAPQVRSLFPTDMRAQKKKLIGTLSWVIDNLEHGDALKTALRDLGRRHDGYGAQPQDYPVVADAMLAAMAEVCGSNWSQEIEADWRTALERMSDTMLGRS